MTDRQINSGPLEAYRHVPKHRSQNNCRRNIFSLFTSFGKIPGKARASIDDDYSGNGLPFVSGANGSTIKPSKKIEHIVTPA